MSMKWIALLVFVMSSTTPAWASVGDKDRGDWHIHNATAMQVIVDIAKADGTNCFSSYVDPEHTLGLPAHLHDCPFPIKVTIKVMQQGESATCEVTLDAMKEVTFNGETCTDDQES